MSGTLTYSNQEIINHLKISGQIPGILHGIATQYAIMDAVKTAGLKVSDEELQQGADQLRLDHQLIKASDTIDWLHKQGLTEEDFEEIVRRTILVSKLTEYLFAKKVEVTFAERQLDYTQAAIYEVVLEDEELALELYYALKEGELSFQAMAKQYITDTELARKGGYLGLKSRKDLPVAVRAAVFAARPPQLLKPVVSKEGTHIIQVEEIVQPKLTPTLRQEILSQLFFEWIKHRT